LFKTTLICYICQTTKTDIGELSRIFPVIRKLQGTQLMTSIEILLPDGWKTQIGYSNGISVEEGQIVFTAGQVP